MNWLITRLRYPWVMMHIHGMHDGEDHYACGKEAFYLSIRPRMYSRAESRYIAHLDGTPLKFESKIVCESCGEPMRLRSSDVRRRGWFP